MKTIIVFTVIVAAIFWFKHWWERPFDRDEADKWKEDHPWPPPPKERDE